MIEYCVGQSGQSILFTKYVLQYVSLHRQLGSRTSEAGGQPFAQLNSDKIIVEKATGPRPQDRRTRFSYFPHRPSEQEEIFCFHTQGLHYVGDWHTHPQRIPTPSSDDFDSMSELFRKSEHSLNAFILMIVGQTSPPTGLHVSLHNSEGGYVLQSKIAEEII